jgi:hypothetical protein
MFDLSKQAGINPAVESWLMHIAAEHEEDEERYRIYREYYDGLHREQLTDEMRDYLRIRVPGIDFSANYMQIVVNSIAERTNVVGVECDGQTEKMMDWWDKNEMDYRQLDVHTAKFRDGDSYVLVDFDPVLGIPRFTPHMAFDGTSGMHVEYSEKDGSMLVAIKRWVETLGPGEGSRRRAYVYYPERIVSLAAGLSDTNLGWEQLEVIPWPVGQIPVVHFKNRGRGYNFGMSEMAQAIPMQDALNKMVIAHIAAAQTSAFRIITWTGNIPDEDIRLYPGGILYDPLPESKIGWIPGEALRPMIETVDSFVQRIGQVSDTPLSYFQLSGQMASEGTHKQHEARLIAKARIATVESGAAWSRVMALGRKVYNYFGAGELDEGRAIKVIWDTLEVRDASQRLTDKFERLKLAVDAGANFEAAARMAGFTDEEAAELAEVEYPDVSQTIQDLSATNAGPNSEPAANRPGRS